MARLAIVEDREEDKYEHTTAVKCWKCNPHEGLELSGLADVQACMLLTPFPLY